MKTAEIKNLPRKPWAEIKTYQSIMVMNSGKKHDSGRAIMYIVGLDGNGEPIEIAGQCDDINWIIPAHKTLDSLNIPMSKLRTDWQYKGHIRFWSPYGVFSIGNALSSTDITLVYDK